MATTGLVKIGTVNYTVYGLTSDPLADANTYMAARVGAGAWTAADAVARKQALVTAFRAIERMDWSGQKLVPSQATDWPRTGATCDGAVVPDGTPDDVALGEFELALALLQDPTVLDKKTTTSGSVKEVHAGTAGVTFFAPSLSESTRFPTIAQELLGCFLTSATGAIGLGLASGTDEESAFSPDDFERDDPLG